MRVLDGKGGSRNRSGARLAVATIGPLLVVAFLLITSEAAAQALPTVPLHTAPLTGTKILGQTILTFGCSAVAAFSTPPTFNLTTGVGKVSGHSSVAGCGLPGASDNGSTTGIVGFDSQPFPGSATYTKATLKYALSFVFNLTATPASPAGGPFAWASYKVETDAYLVDESTLTIVGGCGGGNFNSTNGSASGMVSGHLTPSATCDVFDASGITVPGQQYYVEFIAYASEWSYAPSGTTTMANARLNMATGGHDFVVKSWSIT